MANFVHFVSLFLVLVVFLLYCPFYLSYGYDMGQIIKSVCVCQSVCPSVGSLTVAFLIDFTEISTNVKTPEKKNEFVRVNIAPLLPHSPTKKKSYAKRS